MIELYAVKDIVSGSFAAPVAFKNTASARRWFNTIVHDSKFAASDFQLFQIGLMSDETGQVFIQDDEGVFPRFICSGVDEIE